jgi:hypothetical protein
VNSDLSVAWHAATRHFEAREYDAAAVQCDHLMRHAPDQPMAYSLMSRLWQVKGRVRPATLSAFHASQRIAGAQWGDVLEVSTDLLNVGERHLAYEVLSHINPHDPANVGALLDLGRQYSTLEDQHRALYCIEQARAQGCDGGFVDHMLGIVLSFTGPIDRAVAACEDSVAKLPTYGHAHWSRAQFGQAEGAEARVDRMRVALGDPAATHDDSTFLHYGLFKELDVLGRTDEAWQSLMAGAAERRSVTRYTPQAEDAAFDALIHATSHGFFRSLRGRADGHDAHLRRRHAAHGDDAARAHPGQPSADPAVRRAHRLPAADAVGQRHAPAGLNWTARTARSFSRLDYALLGRRYLEKTRWQAKGRPFFSDKHPMNFISCGPILRALPHAKIIHLRRHPMDACFSNLKELFAKGYYPYSYALHELANHYRNYDRLMRHWHAIAPGRILDVRYEDLVSQPEHEARRVQEYLGLPAVEGVTDILANKTITTTASTLQLRQPIHRRNIGGWRRYEAGLAAAAGAA